MTTTLKVLAITILLVTCVYYYGAQRRYQFAKLELLRVQRDQNRPKTVPKIILRRELGYAQERLSWTRTEWEQAWRVPYHGAVLSILLWLLASTRQRYLRRHKPSMSQSE